ncbi:autorepressor SdpR family transcription factor [Nitrospirillum sp. BR 11752]|uniref:autorepressor SdpR family transcription factor n=1 Tax=Nitrospirillum sp. BR 11752 TaxID=3104293 RepID=UPI002EB47664|nr:autorepressor SdpR family transcription factor [Nitrospirillum sp. BR 11752]
MNRVFKALADPSRRRILQLLREGPLSAGDIARHFDLAKPTLSGHFAVLREADLVDQERQGTTIYYRLNLSVLEEALSGLMDSLGIAQGDGVARDIPLVKPGK